MAKPLRIASVNVNGIRASFKNGMAAWLDKRDVDILALQEVRATTEIVQDLLGRSRRDDPLEALTPRERDVLALMAEGRTNQGIVEQPSLALAVR